MSASRIATRRTLVICAAAVAVAVGAGAAIAATTKVFDPREDQEAFQAAVAEKLGVTTAELETAYKEAALERLEAAVAAGRITEAEAAAIRERIESGDFMGPHGFGFGGHVHGPGHHLTSAADYLGLTGPELHERLRAGDSLADIARAEGKSVEGLKQALLADAKKKLDHAVDEGMLTATQRDEMLERLEAAVDAIVNGTPPRGRDFGFGFRHRFDGPMNRSFVPLAPPDA